MTALRSLYVRYLRGTPLGNAARSLYHGLSGNVRSAAIDASPAFGHALRSLKRAIDRVNLSWYRATYVTRHVAARAKRAVVWLANSRETSNFTYDLTPRNESHLAEALAMVTGKPAAELLRYIGELHEDAELERTVTSRVTALGPDCGIDPVARFGRRVGWYALARAIKPAVIVETGVEKGLGAMVLCAALLRNAQEGRAGRYFGTDIDPGAGALFVAPYNSTGAILYGDSIASLTALNTEIDLFINDSDHSAEYESREYQVVASKLSVNAVVIGDNAHVSDALLRFSHEAGRRFLFFREDPAEHWYPGAGIGFSFK
jgi:hypothetical protein